MAKKVARTSAGETSTASLDPTAGSPAILTPIPRVQARNPDISLLGLKQWAIRNLPAHSKLRELVLAERETMTAHEFVTKVETWLLLLSGENC